MIIPAWKLSEDYICSSVKTATFEWLKKSSHCSSFAILDRQTFFHMYFVSHGITLAKRMVKQGEVIFFLSDKKFRNYFIDNYNGIMGEYKDNIINLN